MGSQRFLTCKGVQPVRYALNCGKGLNLLVMVRALLLSKKKKKKKTTQHGKRQGRFLLEHALSLESKASPALYATDTSSWVVLLPFFSPKR